MTWDRVERLLGSRNLEKLAQARVGVVGLGSGGGFAALSLAMSGVGKFVLIDDDKMGPQDRRTIAWSREMRQVAEPARIRVALRSSGYPGCAERAAGRVTSEGNS